jgi:hypothetical protein
MLDRHAFTVKNEHPCILDFDSISREAQSKAFLFDPAEKISGKPEKIEI